jgi:hypothetical protein
MNGWKYVACSLVAQMRIADVKHHQLLTGSGRVKPNHKSQWFIWENFSREKESPQLKNSERMKYGDKLC